MYLARTALIGDTFQIELELYEVVCHECGVQNKIATCGQHRYGARGPKAFDTNTRIALGAIDNGIGFAHINSFLSTLNVPTLSKSAYKKREREVGKAIEEVALNSCKMILEDEICEYWQNSRY